MKCPFIYSNGHQCDGEVYQARAYGKNRNGIVKAEDIKKIRLWCSTKGDHDGAVSSFEGKLRMEFYPNELGVAYQEAVSLCENVVSNETAA